MNKHEFIAISFCVLALVFLPLPARAQAGHILHVIPIYDPTPEVEGGFKVVGGGILVTVQPLDSGDVFIGATDPLSATATFDLPPAVAYRIRAYPPPSLPHYEWTCRATIYVDKSPTTAAPRCIERFTVRLPWTVTP